MKIKAIILEDEPVAARKLQRMLIAEGLEVESLLDSVSSAIKYFQKPHSIDLAFFDIELGDGQSFEIFEKVQPEMPIIFTTAYDDYAIKAFKLNSIDYLLKPIDKEELHNALEKFKQHKTSALDFAQIQNFLGSNKEAREYFMIKIGQHLKSISRSQVELFYSSDKLTFLHSESKDYPIDYTLDELENELPPNEFFRVSRSEIIARKFIQDIIIYSGNRFKVKLKHSTIEPIVSRGRANDFKTWLGA